MLFYTQTTIILKILIYTLGPTGRSKIEGWDVTFAMDWQIIPQSNNTQTAGQ